MRLAFVLILLMTGMKCMADTHYVSLSGTNNSPYTNWADASTDVTWAVTAAAVNDTVLVTNGLYYPTQRCYNASAITLRSVNGRDATIINGANNTNICASLGSGSVFDGFTVTNCNNTIFYGIISCTTVRNCLFVKNTTKGGSVYACTSATNCIFRNNTATILGPGIYMIGSGPILVANCRFESNRTTQGASYGGAMFINSKNTTISNCTIINNAARDDGGGICFSADGYSSAVPMTNNLIVNCIITGNVVTGGGRGGGISCYYCGIRQSQLIIKDCSIIGNIATNQGGGLYIGGTIGTNAMVRNCLIARNQSLTNTGGGIWMTNSNVESCTIVSNYAAVSGGGVYVDGPECNGTNNIIYFNTAGVSANNFTNSAGNTGLNYSCVIPAVGGAGNITNNPLMLDLDGGNYHLRVNSPCVNAGTNQPWMPSAIDLDGIPRIRYGIVDMGAYEAVLRQGNIYRVH